MMSPNSRLRRQAINWKSKCADANAEKRALRQELNRQKGIVQREKEKNSLLTNKNKELESKSKVPSLRKVDVQLLALRLFNVARISFRATSRVLSLLSDLIPMALTPCPQTIINWHAKLAHARMFMTAGSAEGMIFIIDISIALTGEKILAVLGVSANHYAAGNGFPKLSDAICFGVKVSAQWRGEDIARFLEEIIERVGKPLGYLKDGAADLEKGCRTLDEKGIGSPRIKDISHFTANLLKAKYGDLQILADFVALTGSISKRLKQTILACLAPPKVRSAARFMNLHRLVDWAHSLLALSPPGRAKSDSILDRLRRAMDDLPIYKTFIKGFLRDSQVILKCQELMKQRGLNEKSAAAFRKAVSALDPGCDIAVGLNEWLLDAEAARALIFHDREPEDRPALLVSSDPVESAFGVGKAHGCAALQDPNRIALRLPAECGSISNEEISMLNNITQATIDEKSRNLHSVHACRYQALVKGNLDALNRDDPTNLAILPIIIDSPMPEIEGLKSANGTPINPVISEGNEFGLCPPKEPVGRVGRPKDEAYYDKYLPDIRVIFREADMMAC